MISGFSDLWPVLLSTSVIFLVLLLLFRKHIFHVFDPLLYFLVTQAFSIEMAFLAIKDIHLLSNFLLSQFLFSSGFFLSAGRALTKPEKSNAIFFNKVKTFDISALKWYVFFATILLIIGNLILIKQKGIALFAADPSAAKVEDFTEGTGLGIVRRMNSGLLYFVALLLIYLLIYKKQLRYGFMVLILIMFTALSGSKSSLIFFVFLSAFFFCFKDLKKDSTVKKLKAASYFIIIASFALLGIILGGGSKSFNDILLSLGVRFLYYGDAIMYYFNHDTIHYFSNNNFFTFLYDELNYILGFFRLVPYNESINFRVINYYYNMPTNMTFGPNIPYYIKGNIYFGFIGGLIFSFITGYCVGFIRWLFYMVVRNRSSSVAFSMIIIYLNLIVYSLPQDSLLFSSKIFDIFILSLPLFVIVYIIHLPKLQPTQKTSLILNV